MKLIFPLSKNSEIWYIIDVDALVHKDEKGTIGKI